MAQAADPDFSAAEARGSAMLEAEQRAVAARYDRATGRVIVDLVHGCTFMFPARLVQDLHDADDDDLADVTVDGMGFNLRWSALDADLYVPALVGGVFGTEAWMRGLPRMEPAAKAAEPSGPAGAKRRA